MHPDCWASPCKGVRQAFGVRQAWSPFGHLWSETAWSHLKGARPGWQLRGAQGAVVGRLSLCQQVLCQQLCQQVLCQQVT